MTSHIPPLRFSVLTPAYDLLVRWTSGEEGLRAAMLQALDRHHFEELVDLGCGTGSFLALLGSAFPWVRLTGIDADRAALEIARRKLEARGVSARLLHADARRLPLTDGTITAITSSLFFHHLDDQAKADVLQEVRRCLAPDGVFLVADWTRARSLARRAAFNAVRILDGFGVTRCHAAGCFPAVLVDAGFRVDEQTSVPALLGEIGVWTCRKPLSPDAGGTCRTTGTATCASAGSPESASR